MTASAPDEFDALKTISETLKPFKAEDQSRLLRWISEKLGLVNPAAVAGIQQPPAALGGGAAPAQLPTPPAASGTPGATVDIKSFVTQKQPKNDVQFAAVVAYYHRFEAPEVKESITKDDLITACRLAGRDRPPAPQQTLRNALNAGLLDSAGAGNFSINTVGENLVAVTLPGDVISGGSSPNRRGRGGKKPAKRSVKKASKKVAPKKK
jgi:hypothetical protein